MENVMRHCRPLLIKPLQRLAGFSMLVFLLLAADRGLAEQQLPAEGPFPSVEERRLQVRIIEEHDTLASEKKAQLIKEKKLRSLEADIDRKLQEIDQKLADMAEQKAALEELLGRIDEARHQRLENLGTVYENMNPIQASRALNNLEIGMAADILAAMRPRSAARIINGLAPEKASEISRLILVGPADEVSDIEYENRP